MSDTDHQTGRLRIVVSSRTGNTLAVAKRLEAALPGATLERAEDARPPEADDLILLGFWVDKGEADARASAFLSAARAARCRAALFGTLGSDPGSPRAKSFAERLESELRAAGDLRLLGPVCLVQGKIDPAVIEAMDRRLGAKARDPERLARLDAAARHPDQADFAKAEAWAKACVGRFQRFKP